LPGHSYISWNSVINLLFYNLQIIIKKRAYGISIYQWCLSSECIIIIIIFWKKTLCPQKLSGLSIFMVFTQNMWRYWTNRLISSCKLQHCHVIAFHMVGKNQSWSTAEILFQYIYIISNETESKLWQLLGDISEHM
jgi:hypothetical protein